MKHDVNPNWTTTEPDLPPEEQVVPFVEEVASGEVAEVSPAAPHRIRVEEGKLSNSRLAIFATLGGGTAVLVSVLFLQGLNFLQANIIADQTPDYTVTLTEEGFTEVNVLPGDVLELQNTLSTVEQYRSELPDPTTGAPLIATPSIPPSGSQRISVPEAAAGKEVILISGFNPLRRGTLRVGGTSQGSASSFSQNSSSPEEILVPSLPEVPEQITPSPLPTGTLSTSSKGASTSSSPSSVSSSSASSSSVSSPSPVVNTVTLLSPTVDLGLAERKTLPGLWPTMLRVNRFTVGSPLVPDLSPMVSIPMHRAAPPSSSTSVTPVHHAPATGPELWILFLLSAAIVPVYWVRKVR
ncbi:MAG TPA: hypothetical protein VJB60_04805 [Candidatus Peribacterales bacterium]|nr:hypothetical protein [Candidatus Peribacterales bacterium]